MASTIQHSVFVNPASRTRASFPFVAVLQADLADEGRGRIVAPMAPRSSIRAAAGRLLPVVKHDGQDYLLALEAMVLVPMHALRKPVGSIAEHRDQITQALDWLFTGI